MRTTHASHSGIVRMGGGCAVLALTLGLWSAGAAVAKVSPEEAAKVGLEGTELTPLGAIRAGNADGSIPAYTGGITQPPAGYTRGDWYIDPYSDDEILFTITADNYQQYKDKLADGQIALFEKYPDTYKMHVYKTHRSASHPRWYLENSVWNASNTQWCDPPRSEDTKERCVDRDSYRPGLFFPIPKTGGEAIWNHTYYFFGKHWEWTGYGFNAYTDGGYAETTKIDRAISPLFMSAEELPDGNFFKRDGGAMWCFSQEDIAPPRAAGTIFGGCNYFQSNDFDAYLYIPGQRRVRKAPEIGFYDSPGTGSDGLRTADQRFLFAVTGDEEWYNYEQPERREMYIPYNNYKLASPEYDFDDIVRAGHNNPDLIRYELHRVWVIRGKLKDGFRHLGPRRVVYVDEDSWVAVHAEMYDTKDELWRVSEAYPINYYDVPMLSWWGDSHMDLISGRYAGVNSYYNVGADRGTGPPDFHNPPDAAIFTPAGLRKYGVR